MKAKITYKHGDEALWSCQAWSYWGLFGLDATVGVGKTWGEAKQRLLEKLREKEAARARHRQRKVATFWRRPLGVRFYLKEKAPPDEVVEL